jgi:hypothetical protein
MQKFKMLIDTKGFNSKSVLVLVFMVAVLLLTVAVYVPGLPGPLLTDDVPQLKGLIDNSADATATLIDTHLISKSGPFGRPVAMATFIGDAISHGPDIWWWKFGNVMYHLIAGLLIFWLSALLVMTANDCKENRAWFFAAVVAAFWLLHPQHVSTVLYTVQRMTELSNVFVLAGLVFYVKGRRAQLTSMPKGWLLIGLGFGVFFPLALLSKETALLFPLYCALVEILIFRFAGSVTVQKQVKAFHGALLLGYVSVVAYVLANFSTVVLKGYAVRDFTLLERVLTQPRVIGLYIAQLLRPVQSKMGFFHDDLVVSTGLFEPVTTFLSIGFLVALLVSAIMLRKRLPLYSFGILFFFAAHALESSIFSLELMFEHRNHLASFGIVMALVALMQQAIKGQRAKVLVAVLGLCGLSFLTMQRAVTWASAPTMYDFMYYAHPKSQRLNFIFADVYSQIGEYDNARQALTNVAPGLATGIYGLYLDCLEFKNIEQKSMSDVLGLTGGKVNGHVIANTKLLAESVLDGRCSVPAQSMAPLFDHLLTMPVRTGIDQQVLLDFRAEFIASEAR